MQKNWRLHFVDIFIYFPVQNLILFMLQKINVVTGYIVTGLELLELRVPAHVPLGTRASLSCRWKLGPTDVLYSVKWYKDGKEFFRHVPRDVEPRRKFLLPGVDVEVSSLTSFRRFKK